MEKTIQTVIQKVTKNKNKNLVRNSAAQLCKTFVVLITTKEIIVNRTTMKEIKDQSS